LADDRSVALKIAPPPDAGAMTYERDIMATEATTLRLLHHNTSMPGPESYAFGTSVDPCAPSSDCMNEVHGDNLEHVKAGLSEEAARAIREETGRVVRAINAFTGEWFGYPGNTELRAATWPATFDAIVDSVLVDAARKSADCGADHERIRRAVADNR